MKTFWTCWLEGTNGGRQFQHESFGSAEQEAKRIALMPENDGKKVYILMCLGAVSAKKTTWEQAASFDVPF